jgi:hypothetical protein
MHVQAAHAAEISLTNRSKVTNGSKLLTGIDGRSATARRFRDLSADFAREHGGGSALSPAELGMVRQAAAITLRAEQLQAAIVRGEPVLADELIRLSSEARRILSGLRRRHSQKAPPTLTEYLAGKHGGGGAMTRSACGFNTTKTSRVPI